MERAPILIEKTRNDSVFGSWMMHWWEAPAGDPLRSEVAAIWDFEGSLAYRRERLFPDGMLQIVVQLDDPHRLAEAVAPFPSLCVDGIATLSTTIEAPLGRCRVLGIRLQPLGAFALLRTSLAALRDRSLDLRDVVGQSATELGERLSFGRSGAERIASAEAWVRRRFASSFEVDPAVAVVFDAIRCAGGALSLGGFDTLTGRSRSRLAAAFRDHVGLTPKRYARIVRFRHAIEMLGSGTLPIAVAAEAGYYDQAHLCEEFREHAGLTPSAYADASRYPGGINLAEMPDVSFFQDAARAER